MKAIVINDFVKVSGSPTMLTDQTDRVQDFDEITVAEVERPVPKSNEVLVQVKAAGVNYVDTLYACASERNLKAVPIG